MFKEAMHVNICRWKSLEVKMHEHQIQAQLFQVRGVTEMCWMNSKFILEELSIYIGRTKIISYLFFHIIP